MNWNKYSLFKLPNKHRRFEYVPRYYDPRKEELEKKIKAAEREANLTKGKDVEMRREISFRQRTSDHWGNSEFKSKMMNTNIRLIVILGIALIGFYFLFEHLDGWAYFLDEKTGK
ncbi:MAG: hypothetical protein HUJ25_13235 [Crocinitomicaceae bacterium]|nr:hypothetical protein [Crocinitomicaceae bacterium]